MTCQDHGTSMRCKSSIGTAWTHHRDWVARWGEQRGKVPLQELIVFLNQSGASMPSLVWTSWAGDTGNSAIQSIDKKLRISLLPGENPPIGLICMTCWSDPYSQTLSLNQCTLRSNVQNPSFPRQMSHPEPSVRFPCHAGSPDPGMEPRRSSFPQTPKRPKAAASDARSKRNLQSAVNTVGGRRITGWISSHLCLQVLWIYLHDRDRVGHPGCRWLPTGCLLYLCLSYCNPDA